MKLTVKKDKTIPPGLRQFMKIKKSPKVCFIRIPLTLIQYEIHFSTFLV